MRSRLAVAAVLCLVPALAAPTARARPGQSDPGLSRYRVFFAECPTSECGKRLIVLRSFRQGGAERWLVVDPVSLVTSVLDAKGRRATPLSIEALRTAISSEPYGRALDESETQSASRQDAGIVHALPQGNGVVLTIDLCPSAHALDRRLFRAIIDAFLPIERPVPLGVAVTGKWMREHAEDLEWLRGLETKTDISVVWINHSFNHHYAKDLPMSRNFLLQPGTDLRKEVLDTEVLMLRHGLRPSIFFRFPGLVSDRDLVKRVTGFGLVAVGTDAWLAKKQDPSQGSIVLVHGNGNEPYGVARFLALLRKERLAIRSHDWLLFDLRDSVRNEEESRRR